jgi:elongator complex protein 3
MNILELAIKKLLKSRIKNRAALSSFKRKIAKKYKIQCPSNIELLKAYHELLKKKRIKRIERIENLFKTRPIRSLSGIVNVSVLTKPYPCPGKCLYCPFEKGMPKSYLSGEPAAERAKRLKFNPYLQVKKRIEMLKNEGHPTDKIDLRIIGGTWSFYPQKYRSWFIKRCFDACNEKISKDLRGAQKLNEKARHRMIGISVETRPDFINEKKVKFMRELGITRVELGVQSVFDDILKLNLRGHGVRETILATKILKDAGIKICYQMMPNLPGSNLKKDKKIFEEIFSNPDFQPDYLKIYPCALLKEAPLYKLYLEGKYKPYSKEELIDLIKKIKLKIPYYVRIQRITRDIPSKYIVEGGARISNLRQIVQEEMKKEDLKCKCIRCREVREKYKPKEKIYLFREDYDASDGKEIFLSFENKDRSKLFSFLRLRIPKLGHNQVTTVTKLCFIFPVLKNVAIIREIQTFGEVVPIGERKIAPQHRGLGKKLIKEAEKIVKKESGLIKIAAISGVGVRDYWRKLGYKLKETYMAKKI